MNESRKTLTPEQWKTVENLSTCQFSRAKLIIDGYEVSLCLEPLSKYKNVIEVYVNGKIEHKKLFEDCEERRRFYCPVIKNLLPVKSPKSWKKKEWEAERKKHECTSYFPWWTNFAALRRHLIKNNQNIEFMDNETR